MSLREKLLKQIQPEGDLELQTFERYLHAIEQSERFRAFELESQSRWSNEPNHPQWFHQMERIQKLAAAAERPADHALNEIRTSQRDRFATQAAMMILANTPASRKIMDEQTKPIVKPVKLTSDEIFQLANMSKR